MNAKLTEKELLKDIKAYKKTFKGDFTEKKYYTREKLEKKSLTILTDFNTDRLVLPQELKKPFALYINTFSGHRKNEFLAKLQKQSTFDVTSYINESQKTFWRKLFGGNDKYKAMTVAEMQKKLEEFKRLQPKRNEASVIIKLDNLSREAEKYASNIINNLTIVPNKDIAATKKYLNSVGGYVYKGSDIYYAVKKMDKQAAEIVFSDTRRKPVSQQHNKTEAARVSIFSGFKKKASPLKNKLKAAAVIAGIGIMGFLGFKTAYKAPIAKQNTVTVRQNLPEKNKTQAQTATFTAQKNETSKKSENTANKQDSTAKIWKNYYDNTIALLTSDAKRDMLYKQIEAQLAAGNFTLPQEISVEKAAYAKVMYGQYGLRSSLNQAFSAKQKLSDKAQKKLVKDILAVGNKGAGAKKMAMQLYNGKLSGFSHYNNADKAQKQQHVSALLQLKKLKSGNRR